MRNRLISFAGLIIGIMILVYSGYVFFIGEKTVYLSDGIKVNYPFTAISKNILLKENEDPHIIDLSISYANTSEDTAIFTYNAEIMNNNQIIEKKSSSYTPSLTQDKQTKSENVKDSISLFTLKDIPSGNYIFSLKLIPNSKQDINRLRSVSYIVKSKTKYFNIPFVVFGMVISLTSAFVIKQSLKPKVNQEINGKTSKS